MGLRRLPSHRASKWWFDPEFIAYVLVGLFAAVLGLNALGGWVIARWRAGQRLVPLLVCLGVIAVLIFLLTAMRQQRRFFTLALVLAGIGVVCFVAGSFGFTLPPAWVG
jgi:hypothetical protein